MLANQTPLQKGGTPAKSNAERQNQTNQTPQKTNNGQQKVCFLVVVNPGDDADKGMASQIKN